jgi:hypothetical protein
MLSKDCQGCSEMKACSKRYQSVKLWDIIRCPDGTRHLVDEAAY